MTQDELEEKLKLAGFPVQYHHFSKFVEPPYIVYLRVFDENIAADLSVLGKIKHYQVELYSAEKDTAAEKKLERILNTIDTDYSTSEQYIKDDVDGIYQVIYEIKLIEKRQNNE